MIRFTSTHANTLDSLTSRMESTQDPEEKFRLEAWVYVLKAVQGLRESGTNPVYLADSLGQEFNLPNPALLT